MYNDALIRKLCAEAAGEKDPEKSEELIALLKSVLRDEVEEIRLRASYLAKRRAAERQAD